MSGACYACGVTEWITRVGSLRDAPSVGDVEVVTVVLQFRLTSHPYLLTMRPTVVPRF